jgi:hypothetical protein
MTLDDRDKLGPAEILLLEAADRAIENHGTTSVADTARAAQVRKKVPDPEKGTGGELIQRRDGSTYNTLDYPNFIAADASATGCILQRPRERSPSASIQPTQSRLQTAPR